MNLIERMSACGHCRRLAVEYGINLTGFRRRGANPRDWELPLTTAQIELNDHLITVHAVWLPDRQPDCDTCNAWRSDRPIGPIEEAEALHRAWHLCEPLREICTYGNNGLSYLM